MGCLQLIKIIGGKVGWIKNKWVEQYKDNFLKRKKKKTWINENIFPDERQDVTDFLLPVS